MQGISDPDLFELSEIVEKSSKSGIFSNTRLLMIKDGFLYYFSKVPQDYKGHQPNLMSSLKEFPKSSIEIRHIRKIRLESPKSSTLIIEFLERDMIDREDIRKSLSSKNFNAPVKEGHNELQEWKFTFSNFSKCKQWYFALETLKSHFEKHQDTFDRFTEYMANFDNDLRKSLPRHSPSSQSSLLSPTSNTQISANSYGGGNNGTRGVNQVSPGPKTNNFPSVLAEPQQEISAPPSAQGNSRIQKYNIDRPGIFAIQEEEQQDQDLTITSKKPEIAAEEEIKSQSIIDKLQRISAQAKKASQKDLDKPKSPTAQLIFKAEGNDKQQQQKNNQYQQAAKKKLQTEEAIAKAVSEVRQTIIQQQRRKAQQQALLLQRSLEEKEEMIRKMHQQLELRRIAQIQLQDQILLQSQRREEEERLRNIRQRQIKEQEEYNRLKEEIGSEPSIQKQVKQAHLKEQSIQTEFERNFIDVLEQNNDCTAQRLSRYSEKSDIDFHQENIQQTSLGLQQKSSQLEIEHFDYFWELGQIYKQNDSLLKANKELVLAQFVKKATRQATSIVASYIDENKPKKTVRVDRNIFEIQIVCQKGQIVRTHDRQQLVYSNQNHQRLKRTFKIYNYYNDLIISNLKKKPNYPLRVPFCCLVEYKGYTALVQILPSRLAPSQNSFILKTLAPGIPTYNLRLYDFEAGDLQCCLLTVVTPFKTSKSDETCLLKQPLKTLDFIEVNRRHNISIEAKKLLEEAEDTETSCQERSNVARLIGWARQLKKIMKASTPFADTHKELDFFQNFLQNPGNFIESTVSYAQPITGIFLYYCQKLLGIEMKTRIDASSLSYCLVPVVRSLALSTLDIGLFASKMQKLSFEGKFQLAQQALKYTKQLEDDYAQVLLKQIYLNICKGRYQQSIKLIDLAYQMMTPHDPRRLKILEIKAQCCEALGHHEQVLENLRNLLQQTEYMYHDKSKLAQIYFMIAGTLSRQKLNKELVEVYRKILKQSPSYRHKVILQFSQALLAQQADPHILLDFIQQEHQQPSEAPQTQLLLGDIYFRCKNYQKALSYYEKAFDTIINVKTSHPDLFSAYQRLVESLPSLTQKKSIHRQIITFASHNNLTKDITRKINTLAAGMICQTLSKETRSQLVKSINQKAKQSDAWISNSEGKIQQWTQLEKYITGAAKVGDDVSLKNLIETVDCQKLTERCLIMNRSELL